MSAPSSVPTEVRPFVDLAVQLPIAEDRWRQVSPPVAALLASMVWAGNRRLASLAARAGVDATGPGQSRDSTHAQSR